MIPADKLDRLLDLLAEGKSLRKSCAELGIKHAADVIRHLKANPDYAARYHSARQIGYMLLADEILEIADDSSDDWRNNGERRPDKDHILRSRLRVETRKWVLAKALPKIYGDRSALELSGPDGQPIQHEVKGLVGVVQNLPIDELRRIRALPEEERRAALLAMAEDQGTRVLQLEAPREAV